MRHILAACVLATLLAGPLAAVDSDDLAGSPGLADPDRAIQMAETIRSSLAIAEITLKMDKGEEPAASGFAMRCPNCGGYHGSAASSMFREERPLEAPAFVISPTQVVITDPVINPRFIESIAVRFGEQAVPAEIEAYFTDHNAILLALSQPLEGASPLAFDPAAEGPYHAVTYGRTGAEWTIAVQPAARAVMVKLRRAFLTAPSQAVIVSAAGVPVTLSFGEELAVDGSWRVAPSQWPSITSKQMSELLAEFQQRFERSVLRARLGFRSPRRGASDSPYMGRRFGGDDGEDATERYAVAALIDENTIAVMLPLSAQVTARLERIQVFTPDDRQVEAKFSHSLKDYGLFVATLHEPLQGALVPFDGDLLALPRTLLLSAQMRLQGEKLTTYFQHARASGTGVGFRGQIGLEVPGREDDLMLFDRQGRLIAAPVVRRERERYSFGGSGSLMAVTYLQQPLRDFDGRDIGNVPLTEEEESRLAWLGVELQPLDQELARINKVSDLTRDGSIGAMVSYIYPGSPAEQAGLALGDILIRLHVPDRPRPIDVEISDSGFGGQFPWEQLDRVPDMYYERIPQPWPAVENALTRALTDLGFGRAFRLELFRDGQAEMKDFTVTASPPHFESAGRFKSDPMGLTVRDMTYEVRRYFQRPAEEAGVVVARVEPGGRASVAGIKPFEVITAVNDQPVSDAAQFQKLIEGQDELRLSMWRMTVGGRVTKITMPARPAQPAPATTEP